MDRLTRPNPPGSSRFFLSIILAIGAVFVVLGFVSATDYTPSPVRDTVLVAGKGHESGQTRAGQTRPFDDRDELAASLDAAAGKAGESPA
mgnify:CR=1 FL=1